MSARTTAAQYDLRRSVASGVGGEDDRGVPYPFAATLPATYHTIDATADAALDGLRAAFMPHGSHARTVDAVDELLNDPHGGSNWMIAGHGKPGVLFTGGGQSQADRDRFMSTRNAPAWRPELRRLKGSCSALRLLGCEVGAGADGARLLRDVACEVDAPVLAPTGFVYCDAVGDISLQNGSVWQTAQCGGLPAAIPAPGPDPSVSSRYMVLGDSSGPVPLDYVNGLVFFAPRGDDAVEPEEVRFELAREDAHGLLELVAFESPAPILGTPLAVLSGSLQVYTEVSASPFPFTVYNDRLLEGGAGLRYYGTPSFRAALGELLRR
jgi:hypothetical protein